MDEQPQPPPAAGPPPGWYPDPEGPGSRWWDGSRWTDYRSAAAPQAVQKTSGFAIASLVLGVIGGALLAIIFGFVARRRIKRSQGALKGDELATAGIVLGFAWFALIAVIVALGLAGVFDEKDEADRFKGVERDVAMVIDRFEEASEDERYSELCNTIITPALRDGIADSAGKSCESAFRDETGGKIQAEIKIESLKLTGNTAVVDAEEGGDPIHVRLVKSGRSWRIDEID